VRVCATCLSRDSVLSGREPVRTGWPRARVHTRPAPMDGQTGTQYSLIEAGVGRVRALLISRRVCRVGLTPRYCVSKMHRQRSSVILLIKVDRLFSRKCPFICCMLNCERRITYMLSVYNERIPLCTVYTASKTTLKRFYLKIIRTDFDGIWQKYSKDSRLVFPCFSFHVGLLL